jgi:hypothetical protein
MWMRQRRVAHGLPLATTAHYKVKHPQARDVVLEVGAAEPADVRLQRKLANLPTFEHYGPKQTAK